jgi:hypothetical protein
MAYDFSSMLFLVSARMPTYADWLTNRADLVPTYRYVKRVLKVLQWRCPPKRWRLKNPSHSVFIAALDEVFPDARFWMTHRDVTRVLPSVVELYSVLMAPLTEELDRDYVARLNVEWCELGMRRMIAFRERGNDRRFFDVQFEDFQHDPLAVLQRLYDWLGEELTLATRARMEAWRRHTPRESRFSADAADLGLDASELRQRFRFYSERFGVSGNAT